MERLLAALALQVVHRVDRHCVLADAVEVVHLYPLFVVFPLFSGLAGVLQSLNQKLKVLTRSFTI